jgi:hypothetical protein
VFACCEFHPCCYFGFSFITVREIIVFGINLYIDAIRSFRVGVRFFLFAIFRNLPVAAKPAMGLSSDHFVRRIPRSQRDYITGARPQKVLDPVKHWQQSAGSLYILPSRFRENFTYFKRTSSYTHNLCGEYCVVLTLIN